MLRRRCDLAGCGGVVRPDVVLFGEQLPDRFFSLASQDFPACDLLLVFGTSLAVAPFNHLVRNWKLVKWSPLGCPVLPHKNRTVMPGNFAA